MATDIPFVYVLDGAAPNVVWAVLPIVDCGHYAIALEGPTNIGFVSIDFVIGLAYKLDQFGVWHLEVPAQTGAVGVDIGHSIVSLTLLCCYILIDARPHRNSHPMDGYHVDA